MSERSYPAEWDRHLLKPVAAVDGDPAAGTDPDTQARQAAAVVTELIRIRARAEAQRIDAAERAAQERAEADKQARVALGGTFLLDVPAMPPAIWGKGSEILWARGEALMIAGPQGVGKTTIAGQLLRARLGLMTEVLGYPVEATARRVLYWAMDRPQQAQRALGRLFAEDEREYLNEHLRFWEGPPPADFAVDTEALVRVAFQHEADTVFLDSLKDAAVGLSKDEVGAGYNRARQLALAEGIEVVENHHVVKNSTDGGPPRHLKDVYGSNHLTSGAGSVIMLWGEAGDPIVEFVHLKQPIEPVGPFKVLHNRNTGLSSVYYDEDTDVVARARRCATTGLTVTEAAVCIYGKDEPTRAEVEKARRKLAKYVEQGLLVEKPDPDGRRISRWFAAAPASWIDEDEARERYP